MQKLALVGKDIQHSRSPEIYKKLLNKNIQYDLLDYEHPSMIPHVSELMDIYDGVSITSPYKKHFIEQVELTIQAQNLGAINCIKKNAKMFIGENTDYWAIMTILEKYKKDYHSLNVIVLGDGVMSIVLQMALKSLGISYQLFSRRTTVDFAQLNVLKIFEEQFFSGGQQLIINTCSRDFVFKGAIGNHTIFWDFNYCFTPHIHFLGPHCQIYEDGMNMLELQAKYALSFWSSSE